MDNKKMPKNAILYECEKCDFKCCKQSNFKQHTATDKHKRVMNGNEMVIKNAKLFHCDTCSKIYNHKSGLCRHKKKCQTNIEKNATKQTNVNENIIVQTTSNVTHHTNDDIHQLTSLVIEVVKNNSEFQKQMLDMCKNMQSTIISNNCNNTTTNNNTFNLQVFLNEYCKDAMNISEFIDSFDLQISDLENVGKLGYIEGMSNIIINKIKELDVSKRPIHCSDLKREIIYIKDDDIWEREDANNSKFRKVIRKVTGKNIGMLTDWRDKYPECMDIESEYNDIYMKLMLSVMGGGDTEGNENKIMKKIAKHVVIDKKMLTEGL